MYGNSQSEFLVASADAELLPRVQAALQPTGAHLEIATTAEGTLAALEQEPRALVLLDAELPGMNTGQLLAAIQVDPGRPLTPIVLFSDTADEEVCARVREGVLLDVCARATPTDVLRLRTEMALRAQRARVDFEKMRAAVSESTYNDALTGAYNRATLLSLLFRETDRVQRMHTSLGIMLLDIDDFGHWNLRLGTDACDDLLNQTASRIRRLLRSYDLLGRVGPDEFLIALPGCSSVNGVLLAERVRQEVFGAPFHVDSKSIRLSACFSVAVSMGQSPLVVLRDLEETLRAAKQEAPETIRRTAELPKASTAPVAFLSPTSGEDLVAW